MKLPRFTKAPEHPAKFNQPVLDEIDRLIDTYGRALSDGYALDPFAGVGGVLQLKAAPMWPWILVEIEPEWAGECELQTITHDIQGAVICGDWLTLSHHPSWAGDVSLVVTSPTYGNRMADKHQPSPEDTSLRITYTYRLGRRVNDASSAGMQWGDGYRAFHKTAWLRVWDVMRPGGLFVLNLKDHVRKDEVQPVTAWHKATVKALGFEMIEERWVGVKGMRFGANNKARVEHESVILWRKPTVGGGS